MRRNYKDYSIFKNVKRFFDECDNEFEFKFCDKYWQVFIRERDADHFVFMGELPTSIKGIREGCRSLLKRFDA